MSPLLAWTLNACSLLLVAGALLGLERMRRGPTIMDRILAFDTFTVMVIGMVILNSVRWNSTDYLDLVLVFAFLGFIGTLAFTFYLDQTYHPHDNENGRKRKGGRRGA